MDKEEKFISAAILYLVAAMVFFFAPAVYVQITHETMAIPAPAPSNTWMSDGTTYYNYTISYHSLTINKIVKCNYFTLGHPFVVEYDNALWFGQSIFVTSVPPGCSLW